MTRFLAALTGHLWTALPPLAGLIRKPPPGGARLLCRRIQDPDVGGITLRAAYYQIPAATSVVVIVHGIGGSADSTYCHRGARAALRAGCSAVRVSLRGADGSGDDIYHAAQMDDLRAALQSPLIRRYRRVFLLGYSQGGLNVLHAAAQRIDPRLAGVAAICPPLDLQAAMENFDRRGLRLHKHVMNTLANRSYAAVERRGRACCSLADLQRAPTCAAWNELTIVPRFGFRDANDYYRAASLDGYWRRMRTPALLVFSSRDPIVPPWSVQPRVRDLPPCVDVRWLACGGHIHFPSCASLGEPAPGGIENQCVAWLIRNGCSAQGGELESRAQHFDAVA